MNKVLLGVFLGAVLGVFDGLTALFTPDPAIRAGIVGIIVGSTGKGLAAGLICGLFARKGPFRKKSEIDSGRYRARPFPWISLCPLCCSWSA